MAAPAATTTLLTRAPIPSALDCFDNRMVLRASNKTSTCVRASLIIRGHDAMADALLPDRLWELTEPLLPRHQPKAKVEDHAGRTAAASPVFRLSSAAASPGRGWRRSWVAARRSRVGDAL